MKCGANTGINNPDGIMFVPIAVSAGFFLIVALVLAAYPLFVSDKWLARVVIVSTCFCMWVMYAVTYMSQMNPLMPPGIEHSKA